MRKLFNRIGATGTTLALCYFVCFLVLGGGGGCKTAKLEPGGVYAPTNTTGTVIYSDVGLAIADSSYRLAYETVSAVLRFERDNRVEIWAITHEVKINLDRIRPTLVDIDQRWARARQAYKANPTPAGLSTIQNILAEIQRLIPVVQSQLDPVNTAITNKR